MSSRPSRGAARLAAILDALPDALLLVNANGTVVNANSIALETFEAPGTALVGRGLLDLLPAFDSKRIPGSMRRPDPEEGPRTKPTRMVARRTDGTEFPVEVTSANLEDGRTPYADGYAPYTGDELLMLVVRDLTGTLDTETELARQQRQTEMILRAASEGVVGVDIEGKVVLVNPAAAQILGFRASDLGGQELYPLVHHSRPDGTPLPYEETPLSDTLRSGRKHRVRGQVLWTKDGRGVPVDVTTAPVREGETLVGAVMTFTDRSRLNALAARHAQLRAVLDASLRGPLQELRTELTSLAEDPGGGLWPEANRILHHLAAGYARMTSLIDDVLAYQRLDAGTERLEPEPTRMDEVIAAAVDGAVDLIGPGRAQFAVHAPPMRAMVDGVRLAQALTHLIVDVAGVDATGRTAMTSGDSTIVVAAARRGDLVRIDVRGPHEGGSAVHLPITRGIVERHGGTLQTQEVPSGQGGAYVMEVPVGDVKQPDADDDKPRRAGERDGRDPRLPRPPADGDSGMTVMPRPSAPVRGTRAGAPGAHGAVPGAADGMPRPPRQRQPLDSSNGGPGAPVSAFALPPGTGATAESVGEPQPTGRRRALRDSAPGGPDPRQDASYGGDAYGGDTSYGAAVPGTQRGSAGPGGPMAGGSMAGGPVAGAPGGPAQEPSQGRRPGAHSGQGEPGAHAGPHAMPPSPGPHAMPPAPGPHAAPPHMTAPHANPPQAMSPNGMSSNGMSPNGLPPYAGAAVPPAGRRARRALSDGQQPEAAAPRPTAHALPPGRSAARPEPAGLPALPAAPQNRAAGPQQMSEASPNAWADGRGPRPTGPQQHVSPQHSSPHRGEPEPDGYPVGGPGPHQLPAGARELPPPNALPPGGPPALPGVPEPTGRRAKRPAAGPAHPGAMPPAVEQHGHPAHADGRSFAPPHAPAPHAPAAHAPAAHNGAPVPGRHELNEAEARAVSVRTLGQGVAFTAQTPPGALGSQHAPHELSHAAQAPRAPHELPHAPQPHAPQPPGPPQAGAAGLPGRRRRLGGAPQSPDARPHPDGPTGGPPGDGRPMPPNPDVNPAHAGHPVNPAFHPSDTVGHGQTFAIGAPAAGAEGPEMLDGPGGAIEVLASPRGDADYEAPADEWAGPRRLLVWPEPDISTRQALTDRGYRPVTVRSREEVDAQVAEYPAALFVDPLTGPITRTALQSLRAAAVAAEVPVLVTAGLGQATREAAYGADPAVLLKALAPRDSEQHPPRVLLVESHHDIAAAFTATLERRGMQVAHAASEGDAAGLAAQIRPNLVVMDLMLVRRRRVGIVDWLRANGLLNRTPLVVYTSVDIEASELHRLGSGETVLFLAERSTSAEVQGRIVDLLGKIGTDV